MRFVTVSTLLSLILVNQALLGNGSQQYADMFSQDKSQQGSPKTKENKIFEKWYRAGGQIFTGISLLGFASMFRNKFGRSSRRKLKRSKTTDQYVEKFDDTGRKGVIHFGSIPQISQGWKSDHLYCWGANAENQSLNRKESLNGGGMAGPSGPSQGRAHPQYVGINTMSHGTNQAIFSNLEKALDKGMVVVIPTFRQRFSLGGQISKRLLREEQWVRVQKEVFAGIRTLVNKEDVIFSGDFSAPVMWSSHDGNLTYSFKNKDEFNQMVEQILSL